MKKKYLYNGQLIDEADVASAAKESNLDINSYLQKSGMKAVDDVYSYQGKDVSVEDILDAANESKLGFDDYIQKAGFQKKSLGENGLQNGGTISSEPSKAKQEFQFDLPSARDVVIGQMSRSDETIAKNVEQSLTAADTAMHGAERKQARLDLAEKKIKAAPIAVINAARKSLKIKGLDPNNVALIEKEKAKFAKQLAEGDADIGFDKDGNAGLLDNKGIFESFHDHMMNAINANKEAREFKDMTTPQRVEFANKKMQEVPSPYIGTKESNAASFTGLLGDVTPTLGLYAAGTAAGGVLEAAAPATGGLSNLALKPITTFAFNTGGGANSSAMNNVLERYNLIRQNNPNISDELAMSQAEKGEDIDRLAGIAETALFSAVGGKANVGKTTTGKLLKGIAKSGIDLGAKTAGVEFGRSLAQGEGGQDAYDKAIKKFEENAPVGSLLHATAAVLTGAMKAPAIIKNSLKHDVATKMPQEEVQSLLQKNIEEGNITQEQADKVSGDINEFRMALSKVPDGLPEDAQASVAGLILKRDNIKKEAGLKDESSVDIYNQEIESINNQIKEIYRTGKPLEHEINEATGELYKQPEDIVNPKPEIIEEKPIERSTGKPVVYENKNESEELRTIEENLGIGDKITVKIGGQILTGKVSNVGVHKGQIVVDFKDQNGNERFAYSRNIESIEPKQKEIDNLTPEQNKRYSELLNQDELSESELTELGDLGELKRGEKKPAKQLPQSSSKPVDVPLDKSMETDNAVMQGTVTDHVTVSDEKVALPEKGFVISGVFLKEGKEKGKGSGQEIYKKALDEHGILYSFHPVSEDAIRVQNKLEEKGIAKIENVTLSDGTEVRKISKQIQQDVPLVEGQKYDFIGENIIKGEKHEGLNREEAIDRILTDLLGTLGASRRHGTIEAEINKLEEWLMRPDNDERYVKPETIQKYKDGIKELKELQKQGFETFEQYAESKLTPSKTDVPLVEGKINSIEDARKIIKENDELWDERNKQLEPISDRFQKGELSNKEYIDEVRKLDEKFSKKHPQLEEAVKYLYEEGSKKLLDNIESGFSETLGLKKQIKQDVPLVDKEKQNEIIQETNTENKQSNITSEEGGEPKKGAIETPPPTGIGKEGEVVHSEYPPTSLSYIGTGKLETEFGVEERLPTKTKHDIETLKEADNLIEKGWTPQKALNKIEDGDIHISDAEYINMTRYAAELSERLRGMDINSKDFDATLNELSRVANAANLAGQAQGRALGIRGRFKTVQDGTYGDFMLTEIETNNGAELTQKQKETAQKEFAELEQARAKFTADKEKFDNEVAVFRAEQELSKIKKSTPRTKRTHEDLVKERDDIFTHIKEKLREARSKTSATIVPYANELVAIAPDVLKLARNLVEDGVIKLEEIVKSVHSQLQKEIPHITENDIHDIVAGEYTKKKQTKNELAIAMQNLKLEAQAINKLEAEINGEPKTEKAKIKKNQVVAEFKKKLGIDKLEQLESIKSKNENETARIKEKISKGDFAPDEKKTPILQDNELRKKFPKAFAAALKSKDELIKTKRTIALRRLKQMYENKTPEEKAVEVFSKTLNVPRTIMASFDLSAPLRQGIVATSAHPVLAGKALKFMLESAKSEKVYNRWLDDVHNSPRWPTAEKTKLAITDPESLHVKEAEEAFQGAPYAEKIPIVGVGVKASERAYIGYLNHLRWNLFNMYTDRFEAQGKTFENDPKLYEGLSSFINSSTGRGNMKVLENAAPILNWFLFASRLISSRLNMLGISDIPNIAVRGATLGKYGIDYGFYSKLPPKIRVEAAKDMAKFLATGIATLAIAKSISSASSGNITVEDDPRSSDFGKIKSGNTRWDIWGGFQPYARVLTQASTGQRKAATTGAIQELNGEGFMRQTRITPVTSFARGKSAPIPSTTWNLIEGRDIVGNKATLQSEGLKLVSPLIVNDVISAMKDNGVKSLFTVGVPSAFGVGVQTYSPKVKSNVFNEKDYADPTLKYFSKDWGAELPSPDHARLKITNEEEKTQKSISSFSQASQDDFDNKYKIFFKEALRDIKSNGSVYVTTYTDEKGDKIKNVSLNRPESVKSEEISLAELGTDERGRVLSLAKEDAIEKAKQEVKWK